MMFASLTSFVAPSGILNPRKCINILCFDNSSCMVQFPAVVLYFDVDTLMR